MLDIHSPARRQNADVYLISLSEISLARIISVNCSAQHYEFSNAMLKLSRLMTLTSN